MTLPATTRRAGPFNGNGVTTAFPFTFKVFAASDIQVVKAVSGVETTLVLSSDYTVTLNGDQDATPGGTVTYASLASGQTLSIAGNLAYDQPLDLPSGGNFSPIALENELDRLTMQVQQVKETASRALVVPLTSTASSALPAPEANKLIAWNETASALQNLSPSEIASVVAYGTAASDIFTGTGAQTAFVLSNNPGALNNLDVAIGGVTQLPGVDYTWTSGTTVTFTTAPPFGAKVLIRYMQALALGTADAGSVRYAPAGTGAVATTAQAKLRESVSVKDFGAKGDGVTDDTAAIQAALNAANQYQTVLFPYGTYVISNELVINVDNILVTGRACINAKAGAQFEYMLKATGRNGVTVENLKFDANKDARKATQSVRYMGVAFLGCIECQFLNLRVQRCLGYNGVSAVAVAAAADSIRCRIDGCVMLDSGEAGLSPAKDADGIFTSGEQNIISNCIAVNCTDTGFVIESSNQSVITGCTARLCGAGGAITNARSSDRNGNIIDGLTIFNWYGSVGAIQIGVPGSFVGNLTNSIVSDVTIVAETPTYGGPGPTILVSGTAGFGEVQNLILSNVRIRGAATQGILVNRGIAIHIHNAHITATTDSCIQFQNGTEHRVTSSYLSGGSYGVICQNTSEVFVSECVIRNSTSNGLYAFNTSTLYQKSNIIKGTTGASMTKDSGATLGFANIDIPYSASMTPDATSSDCFTITVTNTTAFTINTPTKGNRGQILTLTIKNASGGVMGTITWSATYYMSSWTNPANTQNRSISFRFDGSAWVQISQTGVDVPN